MIQQVKVMASLPSLEHLADLMLESLNKLAIFAGD